MGAQFISPGKMAQHLRELVDDEDFIQRAVKGAFPEWKKEVRQAEREMRQMCRRTPRRIGYAEFQALSSRKPIDPSDGYMASEKTDAQYLNDMRDGSHALLKALWQSHQRVMLVHEAYGRTVVRP